MAKILKNVRNPKGTGTQVVTVSFDYINYGPVVGGSSVCATLPILFQDT